ncbi:hypothetical protein PQX77_013379 [Marasmius sp. AFHP31]|nr:hypothetical protein PQX77_013379 [Marasmius sp. AFHP31]
MFLQCYRNQNWTPERKGTQTPWKLPFDNESNILPAKLHTSLGDTVIYTLETTHSSRGRRIATLKDSNPAFTGFTSGSSTVGAINWREKTIEVNGVRKKVGDMEG